MRVAGAGIRFCKRVASMGPPGCAVVSLPLEGRDQGWGSVDTMSAGFWFDHGPPPQTPPLKEEGDDFWNKMVVGRER
jgi:hypothetical protein